MDLGLGSLFSGGGSWSAPGNILGALAVGSSIYGLYNQDRQKEKDNRTALDFKSQELAENRRQFDLNYQLAQQKLNQGAAGDPLGPAKLELARKTAKSQALQGAYGTLMQAVLEGRHGEAMALARMVDQLQSVIGSIRR